jgi:hypothetical protein
MRYVPTVPACPNCPGGDPGAAAVLAAGLAKRAAAPPARDPVVFVLHIALAGSLVWVVRRYGGPLSVLPLAALDLAIAAGALARWRGERLLVYVRAGVYAIPGAVLFHSELGSEMLALLLLAHAATAWMVFDRRMVHARPLTIPAAIWSWILLFPALRRLATLGWRYFAEP